MSVVRPISTTTIIISTSVNPFFRDTAPPWLAFREAVRPAGIYGS
jgi:hypothetical protein